MASKEESDDTRAERKAFALALRRAYNALPPEELEKLLAKQEGLFGNQQLGFAKEIFYDAPADVLGSGYKARGISGLYGKQTDPETGKAVSPEQRAQEIVDYNVARNNRGEKERIAKVKRQKQKRQRIKENPSLYKDYKKGGNVRGAGIAQRGVRKAKYL